MTTHTSTTLSAASSVPANYWGRPTRYTVATDGSAKLYATRDGNTRTVTTLRAADKRTAERVAAHLNGLLGLADHGHTPTSRLAQAVDQLAQAYDVPHATFANLDAPADETTGLVVTFTAVLDLPAVRPEVANAPELSVAGDLIRLLTASAAEPDATRRALHDEIRAILHPLDGTVVTAEYESAGWYNVAAWIDHLTADHLTEILVEDTWEAQEICRELLYAWSERDGLLEDEARRIENDTDFHLLVNLNDVVRRLNSTRPDVLEQVYTSEVITDLTVNPSPWTVAAHVTDAARLADTLIRRRSS